MVWTQSELIQSLSQTTGVGPTKDGTKKNVHHDDEVLKINSQVHKHRLYIKSKPKNLE